MGIGVSSDGPRRRRRWPDHLRPAHDTSGTYNPSPQTVYLGANDAAQESGSYPGAIYRNLWVGNGPRPETLGSALQAP